MIFNINIDTINIDCLFPSKMFTSRNVSSDTCYCWGRVEVNIIINTAVCGGLFSLPYSSGFQGFDVSHI